MIDSHVHFWRYSPREHAWIDESRAELRRDYLPEDLEPLLRAHGVTSCIAVQAAQSLGETRFLLELAERHAFIEGVIGWVDLAAPDLPRVLERWVASPKFRGVRHFTESEPDARFLLRPEIVRGIGELARFDLVFELLVRTQHLPAAIELARALPEVRFVLDHLGKPEIARRTREPWTSLVRELSRCENVTAKVSGLATEAGHGWKRDDCAYYVDTALAAFGRERLVLGSDWPVVTLALDYGGAMDLVRSLVGDDA